MAREAAKLVRIKQGDEIVKIPKLVALARRVFAKALEGDLAAARIVFQLVAEPDTPGDAAQKSTYVLPDDDTIKRMVKRFDHLTSSKGNK